MFEFIGGFLGSVGETLVPVLTVAVPALAAGIVQKHALPIPNNAIPYVNATLGGIAGAIMGGPELAGKMAVAAGMGGTAVHQATKPMVRAILGRVLSPGVQRKIGPGERASI